MKVGRLSIFLIIGIVASHTKGMAQQIPVVQSMEPTVSTMVQKNTLIELTGYLGGLFLALCFLPQVIHTLKSKRADDVSMLMLLMSLLSAAFYELYAGFLNLKPVLWMNGFFLILVLVELALKIKFHYLSGSAVRNCVSVRISRKRAGQSD